MTPPAPGAPTAPVASATPPPSTAPVRPPGPAFDTGFDGRARRNIVPRIDGAWEVFGTLTDGPTGDTVVGGLLVCELRLPGTPMFRSRPDLRAKVHLGGATTIVDGPNNRDAAAVSVPLPRLDKDQVLKIEVLDRDLFNKDDWLDAGEATYYGTFPLVLTGTRRKLHATCRLMDAATVSSRLTPELTRARDALARWRATIDAGVKLAAPHLGYPWSDHHAVENGIEAVVALVGWSHGDVTPLRDARTAGLAHWRGLAEAGVKQALAVAEKPGGTVQIGQTTVGPARVRCGSDAQAAVKGTSAQGQGTPRCVLEVTIAGEAPSAALSVGSLDLLFGDGRTDAPAVLVVDGQRVVLDSTLITASSLGRSAFQDALALRVTNGQQAWFLRLR